ncbi:MAG: stage II sporulation protein R [Ruminococcaceae bacterium]|nr:stage II sporulation protein R [Oscillospiraceae bacterium]
MNKKLLSVNAYYNDLKELLSMKKRILTLFLTLTLLIGILAILPIHSESQIYDSVLRLHVIANSDSEEDQALKLLVRDAVLEKSKEFLKDIPDRQNAELIITQNLESLRLVAEQTVIDNGYSYPVAITIGKEKYPTKNYESCAFPAGEYTSLQIMIGNATGQNWWCVLFPPLCLSAATDKDAYAAVGITDSQYQIITDNKSPKYKMRFKILESFSEFLN